VGEVYDTGRKLRDQILADRLSLQSWDSLGQYIGFKVSGGWAHGVSAIGALLIPAIECPSALRTLGWHARSPITWLAQKDGVP
jgi:hypothetical protein